MSFNKRKSKIAENMLREKRDGWAALREHTSESEMPEYNVFTDPTLCEWRSRPKVFNIHKASGVYEEMEDIDPVEALIRDPYSAAGETVRNMLWDRGASSVHVPRLLADKEVFVTAEMHNCSQIGCSSRAQSLCTVCGLLCQKCDAFYHRTGSRIYPDESHVRRALVRSSAAVRGAPPLTRPQPTIEQRIKWMASPLAKPRKKKDPFAPRMVDGQLVKPYCAMLRQEAALKAQQAAEAAEAYYEAQRAAAATAEPAHGSEIVYIDSNHVDPVY